MRLTRVTAAVTPLLGALALVSAAQAGSFNVPVCGAASGAVNHSWAAFNTNTSYLETGNLCSNGGFPGLYTQDVLNAGSNVPQGTEAGWIFRAPAGTTITAASLNRDLLKRDNNWLLFVRDGTGTLLDSGCSYNVSQTSCEVSGPESWSGLSTSSLSIGAHCTTNSNTVCGGGATLHEASAQMASATVTLTESANPTVSSAGGPLLAGGWQSGTQNGTVSASDNTGIQYVRVYVDNVLANTVGLSCDFTYAVPCSSASNASVPLDTTGYSDGSHQVQLAAVNAAGNETRSAAATAYFDNTAPGAPTGITAPQWSSSPINVSWSNPSQGVGSPIAKVHWQACKNGTGCTAVQTQTTNLTSLTFDPASIAPFSSSPSGQYAISVWLEDAAGNAKQANAASINVGYSPATSPSLASGAPVGGGAAAGGGGGAGGATGPTGPSVPATPRDPHLVVRSLHVKRIGTRMRVAVSGQVRANRGSVSAKVEFLGRGGRPRFAQKGNAPVRNSLFKVSVLLPASARVRLVTLTYTDPRRAFASERRCVAPPGGMRAFRRPAAC